MRKEQEVSTSCWVHGESLGLETRKRQCEGMTGGVGKETAEAEQEQRAKAVSFQKNFEFWREANSSFFHQSSLYFFGGFICWCDTLRCM